MALVPVETSEAICYHVVPGSTDGWDVVVERQHHVVKSTHCSDWHRVERLCAGSRRPVCDRVASSGSDGGRFQRRR